MDPPEGEPLLSWDRKKRADVSNFAGDGRLAGAIAAVLLLLCVGLAVVTTLQPQWGDGPLVLREQVFSNDRGGKVAEDVDGVEFGGRLEAAIQQQQQQQRDVPEAGRLGRTKHTRKSWLRRQDSEQADGVLGQDKRIASGMNASATAMKSG